MNFKMADDHHIRHALPYVACTQGYHDITVFYFQVKRDVLPTPPQVFTDLFQVNTSAPHLLK